MQLCAYCTYLLCIDTTSVIIIYAINFVVCAHPTYMTARSTVAVLNGVNC